MKPTHNPDNLTDEQIGTADGWRLLDEDEVSLELGATQGIQVICFGVWNAAASSWKPHTYRTRLTRAELRKARGLPELAKCGHPGDPNFLCVNCARDMEMGAQVPSPEYLDAVADLDAEDSSENVVTNPLALELAFPGEVIPAYAQLLTEAPIEKDDIEWAMGVIQEYENLSGGGKGENKIRPSEQVQGNHSPGSGTPESPRAINGDVTPPLETSPAVPKSSVCPTCGGFVKRGYSCRTCGIQPVSAAPTFEPDAQQYHRVHGGGTLLMTFPVTQQPPQTTEPPSLEQLAREVATACAEQTRYWTPGGIFDGRITTFKPYILRALQSATDAKDKEIARLTTLHRWANDRANNFETAQIRSDEALREICLVISDGEFDPSDGEGTSPTEVVEMVKAERDQLRAKLAETEAELETVKREAAEWETRHDICGWLATGTILQPYHKVETVAQEDVRELKNDRDAAIARAEKAERERDAIVRGITSDFRDADRVLGKTAAHMSAYTDEILTLRAELEKAREERDKALASLGREEGK